MFGHKSRLETTEIEYLKVNLFLNNINDEIDD